VEKVNKIESLLIKFAEIADNPKNQLDKFVSQGKRAIGCYPYYVPEELVYATGMIPMGLWGKQGSPTKAKEYFATFYCSLVQMNMEMSLNGDLDKLSGVIHTTLCDTLRPASQNFRVGIKNIPMIFMSHPQNRKPEFGIEYTSKLYTKVLNELETIAKCKTSKEDLLEAIKVYNENRKAKREFVKRAGEHPELISAVQRSAILKSAYFMEKPEHTSMLKELNLLLAVAPVSEWKGISIVTSGIICDNPSLLKIFDENKIAIVADDVAQESRGFRKDVSEEGDPIRALAMQFAEQDQDTILYDPVLNSRSQHIVELVKNSKAQGLVVLMMTFCDPEEIEYPSLAKAISEAGIPHVKIPYDHQICDFGQAKTSLQAFAEVLGLK
jgi:bcr-type benzoyl-CoA reductase subunit C